jgi:multidrug efflux pump subunit AcrA (membrane-fusion protein)
MFGFLKVHVLLLGLVGGLIMIAVYLSWNIIHRDPLSGLITTAVEYGTVEQIVSVSGITKANNTAELGFARAGTVSLVYVKEGDQVEAGDVLATLGAEALMSERDSALAAETVALADQEELLAGHTAASRAITDTKVAIAANTLTHLGSTEAITIDNAKRLLRSNDLSARTTDTAETAPAPVISGTYHCPAEGSYQLTLYSSGGSSGYSLKLSGLETGTYPVSTNQPSVFGTCGLSAQFSDGAEYGGSTWLIDIPNPSGARYASNKNALEATRSAAVKALELAERERDQANAKPRDEAIKRAEGQVKQAAARVAKLTADIGDLAIHAPFYGTVTRVDISAGETAPTTPVFTVLASDTIELTARIPEIDITAIARNQTARVVFDAESTVTLTGLVSYIAPLPIQIDGVAYFEIKIELENKPTWLRGGLNADIDISIARRENVLRIPKRYVIEIGETTSVRMLTGSTIATSTITRTFMGNDGYVAIEGLPEGTVIVTP